MPQQKPVNDWQDVTDDWQDVPAAPIAPEPAAEPSWFDVAASYIPQPVKSTWNTLWEPLSDLPSRAAGVISEPLMQYGESGTDWTRTPALYGGAFAQSVGDVLSGLTSPGNIGLAAATGGAGLAGRAGVQAALPVVAPRVAQGLAATGRALGGATAVHGGLQIVDPNTTMFEKGLGAIEAVGGGLAARARVPSRAAAIPEELPVRPTQLTDAAQPAPAIPETLLVRPPEVPTIKPKIRANPDGTFTDVSSGQTFDQAGNPVKPFDPSTLQGLEPAPPSQSMQWTGNRRGIGTGRPEMEFIDPSTGEVKPASQAKPGDVPLTSETPITPEIVGRTVPETPSTAADKVTESLNQRLQKAIENPDPNTAPEEISKLIDEAIEVTDNMPHGEQPGLIRQVLGANKALLTSWDLSAPGRQGKAFIFNKAWWTSLDDMVKAWGSKAAADNIQQSIIEHPSGYFRKPVSETGKVGKSFAEQVGLDLASTEEMFKNTFGKAFEKYSLVGKSSRAHTAFLNKLRSDQFVAMMNDAKAAGLNPETNLRAAKAYAQFINDATGRGSVNIGRWKLERNITALNDVFFAPKNMAGQIRTWNNVLNPVKYYNYDPVIRKQALKSLFAVAGMGLGVGELSRLAGAKVSNDPTSSDFRKIRIEDTRIDPFGGYQQFPVAAMKFILGQQTSTVTGKTTDLTAGRFGRPTRQSVAERFFTNRLSPAGSFVWAWMTGREFDSQPFEVKRALYERVFPIAAKDIYELAQEDPALAAIFTAPTMMGLVGTQHYTGR